MANVVGDYVLDNGLTVIDTLADVIHIVSADPANYAGVAAVSLGNKAFAPGAASGSPAAGSPNGRKISTTAFTDGDVTGDGTATGWAIVDSVNARLLANGDLDAPEVVTTGNTFGLPSFDITLPGVAA
jgi:hypothetical protein